MLGVTNGNKDVQTPEFYFPVRMCFGCTVACTPESIPEDDPLGDYCESTEPPENRPCAMGQDDWVDCRFCAPYLSPADCRVFCR